MLLGDLLAAARASAGSFQSWLEASDPVLALEVGTAAQRERMTTAGFVRATVADFSRLASEEDWASLVSSMRDHGDPGTVCLLAMVNWRLTVGGCGDHCYRHAQHHQRGAADERPATRPAD